MNDEITKKINQIKEICINIDSTNKQDVDLNLLSIIEVCNELK